MSMTPIKCDNCGFEAKDGEYDVYKGTQVVNGVERRVELRGDHPYRLNGTHVCDRFEYGTFRKREDLEGECTY